MQKSSSIHVSSFHYIFIVCLSLLLSFSVFGNSLRNEFAVVDDLQGYIENPTIKNVGASIATFKLQEFIYALNYHFFQLNPLPLRIFAICNHAILGSLLFYVIQSVFKKKVAFLALILFLVHPVVTETINWVSAQFYIVMALFIYTSLFSLIKYRNTDKIRYLYLLISIFALDILLIRHAWVFIIPFVVTTFDYFFLERRKTQHFYKIYLGWIIPLIILFIVINFSGQFTQRMLSRNDSGKILQNQQSLIPVIQGYPYSIYNMLRLYIFPKDLTIYYDGNKLSSTTHLLMYSSFFIYCACLLYFYKKDKRIVGLLVLLLVLLLPVFSPKKITWFITERYLYAGTGFFTTLVALLFMNLEQKLKIKYLAYILTAILFVFYASKSFQRNTDWKNPETLALSTIKTSPYSVRPYNDLAGYYVMQNKYDEAKQYYLQALKISSSLTAMRNLGHIYLENGFDQNIHIINQPVDLIYNEALRMLQAQDYYSAAFYLNEVLAQENAHVSAYNRIAELYVLYGKPEVAKQYLQQLEADELADADTYYIYGYIFSTENNYQAAIEYLNKALSIDPNHPAAIQLLQKLPTN